MENTAFVQAQYGNNVSGGDKMANKRKDYWLFLIIRALIDFFYPKIEIVGAEELGDDPVIFVGNHSQMHGPIACELYMPKNCITWCAGQMMKTSDVPSYAFEDFWSQKPKHSHWFYKILSHLIALPSSVIFGNARAIAVHRDARFVSTLRNSIGALEQGKSLIIFPEHNVRYNNIIYDFQDRFIDVARHFYKRSKKEVSFVPMYIAPKLKKVYIGKAVRFDGTAPIEDERARIREYLMKEITDMATALPSHTVIPYRNIPKKLYPKNTPEVKY